MAKQEIEVEYEGTALVTGFNAKYLIDALDVITTETAILEFQGELDPCVIRPSFPEDDTAAGESLAIVMPMRI